MFLHCLFAFVQIVIIVAGNKIGTDVFLNRRAFRIQAIPDD